jgi:hypothetical protein
MEEQLYRHGASAVNSRVEAVNASAADRSGVSWAAIAAGAVGAAALSLILLLLGTGLGLSSVSPWSDRGPSATTLGVTTILWITFMQLAASGLGGYLAGRLRTKWTGVQSTEVYFRDTAHGFLAWAAATLFTAALLTSTIASMLGTGVQAAAGAASAAGAAGAGAAGAGAVATSAPSPAADSSAGPTGYFVDVLFRRDPGATSAMPSSPPEASQAAAQSAEVNRIFLNAVRTGALSPEDSAYLGKVVAQRTGLSPPEAEKRVSDTFARLQATLNEARDKTKAAADAARKTSAYSSLWLFISLLIGAFVASYAATYGGRQRDL